MYKIQSFTERNDTTAAYYSARLSWGKCGHSISSWHTNIKMVTTAGLNTIKRKIWSPIKNFQNRMFLGVAPSAPYTSNKQHDRTTVVEPWTVGASADAVLVSDTLKHKDLFIIGISNGLDSILHRILFWIKIFQNLTRNKKVIFLGVAPLTPYY